MSISRIYLNRNIYKLRLIEFRMTNEVNINFPLKKIVKKWGNSFVIIFDKEDLKIYPDIKEGAILNLSDIVVEKRVKGDEE